MDTNSKNQINYYIRRSLILIFVLLFYIHNCLSPEYSDDFVYKFVFVSGLPDFTQRIERFADIIRSQYDHYLNLNGRMVVHVIAQLFSGIIGKTVFNIFNTIIFCFFIFFLKQNLDKENHFNLVSYALTIVLTLMMPPFNETFVWMTGSINYLWSATGTLAFLALYDKSKDNHISMRTLWLIVPIFFLGWTHEGVTFPLAFSIFVIELLGAPKTFRTTGFWLSLSFLLGACACAFAPSTIGRAGVSNDFSTHHLVSKIVSGFITLCKLRIIYITIIAVILLWFKKRLLIRSLINENAYLLIAIIPALGIVFVSGFEAARTAFGLELYSLIFLLRITSSYLKEVKIQPSKIIGIVLSLLIIVFYGFILYHAIPTWKESKNLITQIQENNNTLIETNEHNAGVFRPYIRTLLFSEKQSGHVMNYYPHNWMNDAMASIYQKDSLVFLPKKFLQEIRLNPIKYKDFDIHTEYEFFVKLIDQDTQIKSVFWQLYPYDFSSIPFFFRPIAKRLGRYAKTVDESSHWVTLELYGHRYIFVKRAHAWNDRLRAIQIIEKNDKKGEQLLKESA